jgi:hypothetical protein
VDYLPVDVLAPPTDLRPFFDAGEDAFRGVIALSGAESLTDDLADHLLKKLGFEVPSGLIPAFHVCDFVVERRSEWRFSETARDFLRKQLRLDPDLEARAHGVLLELGQVGQTPDVRLPRYLLDPAGHAYHSAVLNHETALGEYSRVAVSGPPRSKWLAVQLALEQQSDGILPPTAIEVKFLRGMLHYDQEELAAAKVFLGEVADIQETRIEVAIAKYILADLAAQKSFDAPVEAQLQDSLGMARKLEDAPHEARVLFVLGDRVGAVSGRGKEAEKHLIASLVIATGLQDSLYESRILQRLGEIAGQDPGRLGEAVGFLRHSLDLAEMRGHLPQQAQASLSLGTLLAKQNPEEAMRLLIASRDAHERLDDGEGVERVEEVIAEIAHEKGPAD